MRLRWIRKKRCFIEGDVNFFFGSSRWLRGVYRGGGPRGLRCVSTMRVRSIDFMSISDLGKRVEESESRCVIVHHFPDRESDLIRSNKAPDGVSV